MRLTEAQVNSSYKLAERWVQHQLIVMGQQVAKTETDEESRMITLAHDQAATLLAVARLKATMNKKDFLWAMGMVYDRTEIEILDSAALGAVPS